MSHDLPATTGSRYFVLSVAKALSILEAFSRDQPRLSLTQLAQRSGQNKATARRLALTLVDLGYLQQDSAKQFALTARVLELGTRFLQSTAVTEAAEPWLGELAATVRESVNLAVRDGREVLYLVRVAAAQRILAVNLHVGSRLPLHATSLGKALLMDCDRKELLAVLGPPPWATYTEATRSQPEALLADLAEARRLGVAVANGELELGLRSIAAPLRDGSGRIVAAINVSTPSLRVSSEQLLGPIRDELLKCAGAISRSLVSRPGQGG